MSETQWGDDDQQPVKKKKGLPTWAKIGCGGCGIVLLIGILGIGFLFTKFKDARNPDVQWPKLQAILPFDERPDYDITGVQLGQEQYTLTDLSNGVQGQFTRVPGARGVEAREEMFAGDTPEMPTDLVVMKFEDFEKGVVSVQGRELPIVRFRMEAGSLLKKAADGENPLGPSCFVDLTKPGEDFLFFQLTVPRQDGPVGDGQVREFLAPFHVGPDRTATRAMMEAAGDAVDEAVDGLREAGERELQKVLDSAGEDG